MSRFVIPKGEEFKATISILDDRGNRVDLTNLDTDNSYFNLYNPERKSYFTDTTLETATKTDSDGNEYKELVITIPKATTSLLTSYTGDKVDWYYTKPSYKGMLYLTFTDETDNITSVINEVYVEEFN